MNVRESCLKVSPILMFCIIFSFITGCDKSSTGSDDDKPLLQQKIEWPSLADSPWPMRFHDPQLTSRSYYQGPLVGEITWRLEYGNTAENISNIVIGENDTIYFCSSWEYDNTTGDRKCYIYKATPEGHIISKRIAFDSPDGIFARIVSAPLLSRDGKIWLTSRDKKIYVFDRNLELLFKKRIGEFDDIFGGNMGLDFTYYVISGNDSLIRITSDFNISFNYFSYHSISFAPDGKLYGSYYFKSIDCYGNKYEVTSENKLIAYNPSDQIKWVFSPDSVILDWSVGQCIDPYGNIICSSYYSFDKTVILSIDPEGRIKWKYNIEDFFTGTFIMNDSEGNIYIGSFYKPSRIISIDSEGNLNWEREILDSRILGNMAINSKNKLIVQLYDKGEIVCIE